jgi:hypothetical protein
LQQFSTLRKSLSPKDFRVSRSIKIRDTEIA